MDIKVSAKFDGEETNIFSAADSAWIVWRSITNTDTKNKKVIVTVESYTAGKYGTFGIVYNNITPPVRPGNAWERTPTASPLVAGEYKSGYIEDMGIVDWYSLEVTSGTTYYFWWSENDSGGIHTGNISVTGFYTDETEAFTETNAAWATSRTFTPSKSGKVYICVKLYTSVFSDGSIPGSYAIVYNTSGTRPNITLDGLNAEPLTADVWKNGVISASDVKWYSMEVTMGGTFRIWGNDSYSGNLTKTGRINVAGFYIDGTPAFPSGYSSWTTAKTITPGEDTTVYIRVTPYSNTSAGTYGIVYSAGSARPVISYEDDASGAVALTMNEWKNDTITAVDEMKWYTLSVNSGTTYRIYFNDSADGDGSKTADVSINVYYSDWKEAGSKNSGWSSSVSFTPPAGIDTVYIMVFPYNSAGSSTPITGSYAVVYTTNSTRPVDFSSINPIQLTNGQWQTGGITTSSKSIWYTIPVTSGTYYIWWDDSYSGSGTRTVDVQVSAYKSDGTSIFSQINSGWTTSQTFTVTSGDTVYVLVEPNSNIATGTFGILYTTVNAKPLPDSVTSGAVQLTADTWENGAITATERTVWYSFPVTAGTYRIWWDDSYAGSGGTGKTDIKVSAFKSSDGTSIFESIDSGYTTPQTFTVTSADTVYVKVEPFSSGTGTGTFGVVFSTSTTRPAQ